MSVLAGTDFFAVEGLTLRNLVTHKQFTLLLKSKTSLYIARASTLGTRALEAELDSLPLHARFLSQFSRSTFGMG